MAYRGFFIQDFSNAKQLYKSEILLGEINLQEADEKKARDALNFHCSDGCLSLCLV